MSEERTDDLALDLMGTAIDPPGTAPAIDPPGTVTAIDPPGTEAAIDPPGTMELM